MSQQKTIIISQHASQQQQIQTQIIDIFQKLNKQIDIMDLKVQTLLQKHQAQFVLAYQSHVRRIKTDLEELKQRADQQQKQLKDNNRVMNLEKQTALFREESLKLYERLQVKAQQVQFYKFKNKDLQKTSLIMQKQVRETLKAKKIVQVKLANLETQYNQIQVQLNKKNQQILNLTQQLTQKSLPLLPNTKSSRQQSNNKMLNLKIKQTTKFTTQSKVSIYQSKNKSINHINFHKDNQLRQWFLQCIKSIKRQIAMRKGQSYSLDYINSIDQFMVIDKLRLLQKFLQNQKLLIWMYEKIFPSRINQVREYLSNRKINASEDNQQQLHSNLYLSQTQYKKQQQSNKTQKQSNSSFAQNKKTNTKTKQQTTETQKSKVNYHIGNRVSFKQGKLNILNLNPLIHTNLDQNL